MKGYVSPRKCDFPDCGRPHESRGLCAGHKYQREQGQELRPLKVKRDAALRDEQGRKYCQVGDHWVPVERFWVRKAAKDGLQVRCDDCSRSYYYGVPRTAIAELRDKQGGLCAVCGREPGKRGLHVDHDHACCPGRNSCGKCVRALLCSSCNSALGQVNDDPALLRRLADYVEAHRDRA